MINVDHGLCHDPYRGQLLTILLVGHMILRVHPLIKRLERKKIIIVIVHKEQFLTHFTTMVGVIDWRAMARLAISAAWRSPFFSGSPDATM